MKLFGCLKTNGSELQEEATIRKIQIVQQEGEREVERSSLFYNLDAIIAVENSAFFCPADIVPACWAYSSKLLEI